MHPTSVAVIVSALLFVGAGCSPMPAPSSPTPPSKPPLGEAPDMPEAPVTPVDAYAGWTTITAGGVVSVKIPPGCKGDPGAGTTFITCPTPDNDTPVPDMAISSDGVQVNFRRWEDMEWSEWDKVIASLKVVQPLNRDIQINIQK